MSMLRLVLIALLGLLASCATGTIGQLKDEVKIDLKDEKIEGGLEKAMQNYQLYLEQMPASSATPETALTPEAIRRLADLKMKAASASLSEDADIPTTAIPTSAIPAPVPPAGGKTDRPETSAATKAQVASASTASSKVAQGDNIKEAIALYQKLLNDYPNYELNDQVLYQLARAYEDTGDVEAAMNILNRLAKNYPRSSYTDEVQFRRGEFYYTRKKFAEAQQAYLVVVGLGAGTAYYELALYKLGWTYYKQDQYEEAMHRFVALLDHKVASGYDLEHPKDAFDEKRITDTYRVMSLGFSYLGGADAVAGYFSKHGKRSYEISLYKDMGDYYLDKLRYGDAAAAYKIFVRNNPNHAMSPRFDMWAIDSYKKGGFPKLVIESNKAFVVSYGLKSAYWTHFDIKAFAEVTEYVKINLKELASFYHAQYQDKRLVTAQNENLQEAVKWYREFIGSFPKDKDTIAIHYQFADLLLESKWYGQAAIEYEHIAYDYPAHAKSSAAGYAAIYAHRENLAVAAPNEQQRVKREVIRSSLKFAEVFPKHEKAVIVMSAAVEDIYALKDYPFAAATARKLLAKYTSAEQPMRRAAWLIFAHSSFELGVFKDAEEGYLTALGLTAQNDPARADLVENLAASFYKQGEQANKLGNYRLAATYFFLVASDAPTAKIRPVADFDAATALMQLKYWDEAAKVLRAFQTNYPGHALQPEVTKKIALAYQESGKLSLSAAQYERMGTETQDVAVQRATLDLAADLYVQAKDMDKAFLVYRRYVEAFPKPLEYALEIRTKMAEYLKTRNDTAAYIVELKKIREADAQGGTERTDRTHYLGATAALALAELSLKQFSEIKLVKPFDKNLLKKKEAMKVAKEQLEQLFDYEVDNVTSAATYYLADMYYDFSRALVTSERPDDLDDLEKEQYELSIEEQAYPFEEKTIQVHQKNLELMTRGIFNSWIEKSIAKLAVMVPARYAKFEESTGYIESIDMVDYPTLVSLKPMNSTSPSVPLAAAPAPSPTVSPATVIK